MVGTFFCEILRMNLTSGKEFLADTVLDAEELIRRYTILLELYAEMELVSHILIKAIEQSSSPVIINEKLAEKMVLADRIMKESQIIAAMKEILSERGSFTEDDRLKVRKSEQILSVSVGRIIEQENKSRDLVLRQGIKVSRR
jgi:hypothetical protein